LGPVRQTVRRRQSQRGALGVADAAPIVAVIRSCGLILRLRNRLAEFCARLGFQ
jgi:hypothetical protein